MTPIIRFATQDDAAAILAVYAPYVVSTGATFEVTVPRVYDLKRRIASIGASTPFLVCEMDGEVAGYAYAAGEKTYAAYAWNAYVYVYIDSKYQRCNIASALYLAVISLLRAQGYRKVLARVSSADENSEKFHSAFGFTKVGTLRNAGYKNGRWYDESLFEKSLDDSETPPASTKSVTALDAAFCERNFLQCAKIIRSR